LWGIFQTKWNRTIPSLKTQQHIYWLHKYNLNWDCESSLDVFVQKFDIEEIQFGFVRVEGMIFFHGISKKKKRWQTTLFIN